jgi:peptidoglycan/LPS O-acetylase OafA/YrhL
MLAPSTERSLHHPGLDGLRGVAVLLVIVFHSGLGWVPGGFLGVSLFFTLSGYLIVDLLVRESERAGRPDLRAFWSRRLRRLAPASLVGIVSVVLLAKWLSTDVEAARIRGDAISAVGYVANWRSIIQEQSYGQLFAAPSPLQHLWSLSIEEQLYLAIPLVVTAVFLLGGRRRTLGWVFVALAVVSATLSVIAPSRDVAYHGTHTRAVELLVGAVLACLIGHRLDRIPRWTSVLGVLGTVAIVTISCTSDLNSPWVYDGGLALFDVLSAIAIVGAIVGGIQRRVLSWPVLTWLGRVSYGAYLIHWPVMVWMNEDRLGVGGPVLFAIQLAVTLLIAAASHRMLEMPIRERRWLVSNRRAGAAFVVVFIGAIALPLVVLPSNSSRVDAAPNTLSTIAPTTAASTNVSSEVLSQSTSTVQPFDGSGPMNVLVIGDSTAENVARALADVADPEVGVIDGSAWACPFQFATEVRGDVDETWIMDYCPDNLETVRSYIGSIDVLLLVYGLSTHWDYRTSSAAEWIEVGSDVYRSDLDERMTQIVELVTPYELPVLVFEAPLVRNNPGIVGDEPETTAIWESIIEAWDAKWPAVRKVRYADALSDPYSDAGRLERPDGVHLDRPFAEQLARDVLIPRIRESWADALADMNTP